MGADLLVYHVPIRTGKKPNLKKAEARIDRLGKTKPENWPEEYCESQSIEDLNEEGRMDQVSQLRTDLKLFYNTINPKSKIGVRDLTWIKVGPWTIWLTGGMSWGDAPTESWGMLERLDKCGVLKAMGFN